MLFVCCLAWVKAQNFPNFNRNYNFVNGYYLTFYDIHATDTGYYIVGTMADSVNRVNAGMFAFIELNGDVRWVKNYSKPDTSCIFFNMNTIGNNFLIGGAAGLEDNLGNIFDFGSIWHLDKNGLIIWEHKISYNNVPSSIHSIVVDEQNQSLFSRMAASVNYGIYKLSTNGNLINQQIVMRANQNTIFSFWGSGVQQNTSLYSFACSDYNSITEEQRHFFYVKDTAFNTVDSFYLSGRYGALKHLDKIDDNAFAVSGQRTVANGTDVSHPHIYTLDSNLNRTMNSTIRGDRAGNLNSATRTFANGDGSFTVLGTNIIEQQGREIGFMARVSASGQLLWQRGLYSPQNFYTMYNAAQTSDGGYIVCGDVLGISTGYYQQGWLMKVDSNGCVLPNCHLAAEEVAETKQPAMLLYPNPATDYINIQVALPEAVEITPAYIELIDNKGRVLETQKLYMQDLAYQFYLYNYVAGHYAIRVRQGNKQSTKQFVKGR